MKWDRLLGLIPEVVISGTAAASAPVWLIPFIGLYVGLRVRDGRDLVFSPEHATILVALWRNRDQNSSIDEEAGYEKVCSLIEEFGFAGISKGEYLKSIDQFCSMSILRVRTGRIYFYEDKCRYIKHTALDL